MPSMYRYALSPVVIYHVKAVNVMPDNRRERESNPLSLDTGGYPMLYLPDIGIVLFGGAAA